ncbi:hypothetical protein BSKO_13597 [Bryopsis sp. KO-2023]|nr:hypothetical protein BSKO_13597 [Bryopsis sp. KO-2023]
MARFAKIAWLAIVFALAVVSHGQDDADGNGGGGGGNPPVEITTVDAEGNVVETRTLSFREFREEFGADPPPFELPPAAPTQDVLIQAAKEASQSQVQVRVQNGIRNGVREAFSRFLFFPGPLQGEPGTGVQNLLGGLTSAGRKLKVSEN